MSSETSPPPSSLSADKPVAPDRPVMLTIPAGRDKLSIVIFVAVVGLILAADLGFKAWSFAHVAGEPIVLDGAPELVQTTIPRHEPMVLVPHVLQLWLTTNTGAVFGMGKGQQSFFAVISVLAVGVIGYLFWRSSARDKLYHLSLAMILSGALGNLYDRLRFHVVRDMLHLFPGVKLPWGLAWPGNAGGTREVYPWIFNLADVALVIGVILLMLLMWRADRRQQAAQKAGR